MKFYEEDEYGMRAMILPNGMLFVDPSGHMQFVKNWNDVKLTKDGLWELEPWQDEAERWLSTNSFAEV